MAFYYAGILQDAGWLQPPGGTPHDVVKAVAAWARRCMYNLGDPDGRIYELVLEGQQIYGGPRKQDPNDLLPLAQVVGGVIAAVDHLNYRIILPRLWTGGVPKQVRQRRWLQVATESEKAFVSVIKPAEKRHNTVDAIMLGAWALGRTQTEPEGGYKQ